MKPPKNRSCDSSSDASQGGRRERVALQPCTGGFGLESLLLSSFLSPPLDSFLSSPHCGWAPKDALAAAGRAPAMTANARKLATMLLEEFFMVEQALDPP